MIDEVKKLTYELLKNDASGHGIDHIERVINLSIKFAKTENANIEIVTLAAMLHNVDDYKLFGTENAESLSNARMIMEKAKVNEQTKKDVLDIIKTIGFSKRLKGIIPSTIEGKIVSDADMCDAIGAHAILRIFEYGKSVNSPFFDKNIFPIEEINGNTYKTSGKTGINHIFEKILKLKELMLTESGRTLAEYREDIIISFLNNYFQEENNGELSEWDDYLDNYIKKLKR